MNLDAGDKFGLKVNLWIEPYTHIRCMFNILNLSETPEQGI